MDDLTHFKKRVYYAQNREDLILQAFFPDIKNGFYVDIGAYDPDFESVTKYFYLSGWRGINVEPQPEYFQRFLAKRRRDINVNVGISNKRGKLAIRSYKNGGLSTFSEAMKDEYAATGNSATTEYTDIKVEVVTLADLFHQHAVSTVHFLKVDVEGLEHEVLEGNDWERYRPEVICIEANHIKHEWHELLKKAQYEKVFFDGLNEYFADQKTGRKAKFDYVQSVILEKGGGISDRDLSTLEQLYQEREELHKYANHLKHEVDARNQQITGYQRKLTGYEHTLASIKGTTRHLASLTKARIKNDT